ncbi:MAG: CheR family methyltransferase [Cyanobacteria bacterium P01_F01_bin.53]
MDYEQTMQLEIEALLRQRIGLNPESVGARSIMRAVKRGMRTGKMQGVSDYVKELQTSPDLFESLVESIVVPETSFFRNRASFVFLRQWVLQEWLGSSDRRATARPLRVLSLPCSTGEEPYSIAITLQEDGLTPDQFQIDAVDISAAALAKAKAGVYSPYAFRRQSYRTDDKYFTLGVPDGVKGKRATHRYFLDEAIRQSVSFHQGNVLDPMLLAGQPPYDIIFCRNLLIYFDSDARDRTFALFNRLLRPGGLLFVGYAETGLIDSNAYSLVPYPQTFAYRKQLDVAQGKPINPNVAITQSIAKRLANSSGLAAAKVQAASPALKSSVSLTATGLNSTGLNPTGLNSAGLAPSTVSTTLETVDLKAVRALANQGQLDQAIVDCDRYLTLYPMTASAHLLRGELYQATGDEAAAEACFEKAVYLDSQLADALTHLMLLKEARQDFSGAAVIRSRLQRLPSNDADNTGGIENAG